MNKNLLTIFLLSLFSIINAGQNGIGWEKIDFVEKVKVKKITHFGSHIRIGLENFNFTELQIKANYTANTLIGNDFDGHEFWGYYLYITDESVLLPDSIDQQNINGWSCMLYTSDPGYKKSLAILMDSKLNSKEIDIVWDPDNRGYIDTINKLMILKNVGLSKDY